MAIVKPKEGYIENIKLHIEDPLAIDKFSRNLVNRLHKYRINKNTPIILLCIGTDRSTGDCLGPLIGSKITSSEQRLFITYGTLDQPVHASNLEEKMKDIQNNYPNAFVIAIDACLGKLENVGCINIGDGSLHPGAGVNKKLPPIGHIHITGMVNVSGFMEYLVLQNTRLNIVMKMADLIVDGLNIAALKFWQQESQLTQ